MPRIETVQPKIFRGFGKVGLALGQQFDVYRLNGKSSGSLVANSNFVGTYRFKMERWTAKIDVEASYILKVPLFEGKGDASKLKIGDVLLENTSQKYTDQGAFTYAYFRPTRTFIFVQTPIPATLTRAEPNPSKLTSGRIPAQAMNKGKEQILVLTNGMYSWSPSGVPAAVYLGLQATEKRHELPRPDLRLPTDVKRQQWDVYTGLLPGVQLVESDIVNAANGDRYFVSTPFVQYVGLQGWQLTTDKLRV